MSRLWTIKLSTIQSKYNDSCYIKSPAFMLHEKIDSCYIKSPIKIWQFDFLRKKLIRVK